MPLYIHTITLIHTLSLSRTHTHTHTCDNTCHCRERSLSHARIHTNVHTHTYTQTHVDVWKNIGPILIGQYVVSLLFLFVLKTKQNKKPIEKNQHQRVLLCIIWPLLGVRYGPGVSSGVESEPRRTHPRLEIADIPRSPVAGFRRRRRRGFEGIETQPDYLSDRADKKIASRATRSHSKPVRSFFEMFSPLFFFPPTFS